MTGKIIPFGYADGGMPRLERLMQEESAILVDIRLVARSRMPAFNQAALKAHFGKRYIHMPELGNKNYKGGPIELAYPTRGIARLIQGLVQGYTIVLMCACREYESCHRSVVVERLKQAWSMVRIELPERVSTNGPLKCLSIRQPWAWLIVNGHKELENRDWTTSYRGPVLIHTGAVIDNDWFDMTNGSVLDDHPMRDYAPLDMPARHDYPIKAIIGMANLIEVTEDYPSPWFVGRYGFVFMDAKPFKKPIPYSGQLQLFEVEREVIAHAEVVQ